MEIPGEVNAILQDLLERVKEILGDRFIGLYLYGSLATGDFKARRSDIDFLVVTNGELPESTIADLEAMHQDLWSSGSKWAEKLEGAYVPIETLRRYNAEGASRPTVNEGKFYLDREGSDWLIQRYILREFETIVAGPSLRSLIDPVRPNDLRQAVKELLQSWWAPMLRNPSRLLDRGYQPYAVLSMCRALFLLKHGKVVSKDDAAKWAIETLDPEWNQLIRDALAWREGDPAGSTEKTLDLIKFTITTIR